MGALFAEGEGWFDKPASVNRRERPASNVSYRPGEWQTYDIRLIGRDVTIVPNGKTLIDRKEVEGLTPLEKARAKARTTH